MGRYFSFANVISPFLVSSMIAALPLLILQFKAFDKVSNFSWTDPKNFEEFDVIVVGGGTSGAVLANRLSIKFSVLLLEAGGSPFPLQRIPALTPVLIGHEELEWNVFSEPQKYSSFAMKDNSSYWPRGKMLGGTSNFNFMAWIRGHPADYDKWAKMTNDDRWAYKNILAHFKNIENYKSDGISQFHGYDGEVSVEKPSFNPLGNHFVRASRELGYPTVDLNAPFDEGFNTYETNSDNGRRWATYDAFLKPIMRSRKNNLRVRINAMVEKVLFQGAENIAYGVEYKLNGKKFVALAKNEVILSAGVVNSPQILMLSGIGPKQQLENVGIEALVDRPGVGENLQDHFSVVLGPFTVENKEREKMTYMASRDLNPMDYIRYILAGSGPLTQSGVMATGLFKVDKDIESNISNKTYGRVPDIQLLLLGLPIDRTTLSTLNKIYNLKPDISEAYYSPSFNKDSFHILVSVCKPKSRGTIRLSSANPEKLPSIDPNYLADPEDVEMALKGIRKALQLTLETNAMKEINTTLNPVPFPPCQEEKINSDKYWECYIRHYGATTWHHSGTCSMGNSQDPMAVVDSRLRVIGAKRLRVVDASVMPEVPSSNIQAACVMLGDIGSSFIIEDWKT